MEYLNIEMQNIAQLLLVILIPAITIALIWKAVDEIRFAIKARRVMTRYFNLGD